MGGGRTFLRTFMVTLLSGMAPGSSVTSLQRPLVHLSSRPPGAERLRGPMWYLASFPSTTPTFQVISWLDTMLVLQSETGRCAYRLQDGGWLHAADKGGGAEVRVTYRQRPLLPLTMRPSSGPEAPTDHCPSRRPWWQTLRVLLW